MERSHKIKLLLGFLCSFLALLVLLALCHYFRKRLRWRGRRKSESLEVGDERGGAGAEEEEEEDELEAEGLVKFAGAESLTVHDILEAPGEVVGKSSYGTLYRARIERSGSVLLLRFLRPSSAGRTGEVLLVARALGAVRHPNLVPLRAMYVGPRGEKLFLQPFYAAGSLKQFLRAGVAEAHRWDIILKLSLGIAKGLDHLHTGLEKPIVHGNLKTNNILLDADYQPHLADFGLHLMLNPAAAQEMLKASAAQGYKAPELVKLKDASKETDVYSLGIILFEMLAQKDPININFLQSKDFHLPISLRNLVLDHKISDVFDSELLSQSLDKNSGKAHGLLMLFQLAIACCSPSPASRPDTKHVISRLEVIA
ncbi:putative kinase-like protein TMKL1 [Musa acuminata AAA Group]|uniref:putative kinase-like protein TMKL1 n=1 Tax=Musa acuminata AAA Group TaxID=214697 RepID=UPI0031DB1D9E